MQGGTHTHIASATGESQTREIFKTRESVPVWAMQRSHLCFFHFIHFLVCVWMFWLHVCMRALCYKNQKRASALLELELQVVVSHHRGTGSQTGILFKSSKFSQLMRYLSSPLFLIFKWHLFIWGGHAHFMPHMCGASSDLRQATRLGDKHISLQSHFVNLKPHFLKK